MKKYKTALGRTIDMTELLAKNEKTRAVGNMRVNARGDTIDNQGKIVESITTKVSNRNAKTVGNRSAQPVRGQQRRPGKDPTPVQKQQQNRVVAPKKQINQQVPIVQPKTVETIELSEYEKQLDIDMEDDLEIEKIKATEVKKFNG
jgi:hypothetical protein